MPLLQNPCPASGADGKMIGSSLAQSCIGWNDPAQRDESGAPSAPQEDGTIMADKSARLPDNVAGKFYVDDTCIDCDACRAAAPDNFHRNEDAGYSYVSKQPENEEELQMCVDALESCPVECIGDDGDED